MRNLKTIVAGGLLLCLLTLAPVSAQTVPVKYLSAATNNSTLVNTGRSKLGTGIVVNTTVTVYYLKLYNKATAPTCGTDVPKWTIPIPYGASNAAGGFVLPLGDGLSFPLGLGFCITASIADNDNTSAATGIVVNLGVSSY
jgi:hypothetical protein